MDVNDYVVRNIDFIHRVCQFVSNKIYTDSLARLSLSPPPRHPSVNRVSVVRIVFGVDGRETLPLKSSAHSLLVGSILSLPIQYGGQVHRARTEWIAGTDRDGGKRIFGHVPRFVHYQSIHRGRIQFPEYIVGQEYGQRQSPD